VIERQVVKAAAHGVIFNRSTFAVKPGGKDEAMTPGRGSGLKAGRYKGLCFVGRDFKPTSKFDNEDGYFHIESMFESRKNIVLDPIFKGGDIHCSFGEVVIDLRKTSLPEGTTKLFVDLSFGSVVIIVPDTWNVQIKGNAAFGSFSDNRLTKSFYPNETKRLTIEGKVAFGECELKD